ncbi:MAG: hypothetical protein GY716_18415 [bacterium]|nr:hypothetical protein [bacterium]
MTARLDRDALLDLIERVFLPGDDERTLALLIDLPDATLPDHPLWAERREMVLGWFRELTRPANGRGLDSVELVYFRNARRNNADLPATGHVWDGGAVPSTADEAAGDEVPLSEVFSRNRLVIAATELSATAPMKLLAPRHGLRAATMPGFTTSMIPALTLDWEEIHARCVALKERLDPASAAVIRFEAAGSMHELQLDLRHRKATASGGLVRKPGSAGNLPSGETYIVPYEGEVDGDPSQTSGSMPLELDGELLVFEIAGNRVRAVRGDGPRAERERREVENEPAYSNIAELGLGILSDYGIQPVGELLLDEKLGLHIALGRSDHFGGQVGAADFSAPDKVVHIDHVYLPSLQPAVRVVSVDLEYDGTAERLMTDGRYV